MVANKELVTESSIDPWPRVNPHRHQGIWDVGNDKGHISKQRRDGILFS